MKDEEIIGLLIALLRALSGAPTQQTPPSQADAQAAFGRRRRVRRKPAVRRLYRFDPEQSKIQRRRRMSALHPDKLGRAQTPAELAEYMWWLNHKMNDSPRE